MRDREKLSIGDSIIKLCEDGIWGNGYEITIRPWGVGWFHIVKNEYTEDEKNERVKTILGRGHEIDEALLKALSRIGGE